MTRLFLNSRAQSPIVALVTGPRALVPQSFPDIVINNLIALRFFLVDGFGNYEVFSGDPDYIVDLAIGDPKDQTVLYTTNTFSSVSDIIEGVSTSGWEVEIDSHEQALVDWVSAIPHKQAWLELQVRDTGALIVTRCQQPVQIRNRIIA